jgi:hypothetical protein
VTFYDLSLIDVPAANMLLPEDETGMITFQAANGDDIMWIDYGGVKAMELRDTQ